MLQYAFNLFSHNSPMGENGYNEEETKMIRETHKIWGEDDIAITATCIRVPIMRAHAESINLEFEKAITEEEVQPLAVSAADGLFSWVGTPGQNFVLLVEDVLLPCRRACCGHTFVLSSCAVLGPCFRLCHTWT